MVLCTHFLTFTPMMLAVFPSLYNSISLLYGISITETRYFWKMLDILNSGYPRFLVYRTLLPRDTSVLVNFLWGCFNFSHFKIPNLRCFVLCYMYENKTSGFCSMLWITFTSCSLFRDPIIYLSANFFFQPLNLFSTYWITFLFLFSSIHPLFCISWYLCFKFFFWMGLVL